MGPRGEVLVQPALMERLLAHVAPAPAHPSPARTRGTTTLTGREREILALVARGERSKEIAAVLGITERTVSSYLTTIYNKLGVDSRASAVAAATRRGLLPH